ncbi:hypothetical protein GLOIN_2v1477862 [Rhizophagus irregularis DAOM 181602=DAOM 197198]|uniref:Uncharacterized protein n=1 Tax=Rhizophagus irregularis (strain DAOM 181602 / DAOM 197198 / MUCL 43194) TaxID=747089 RepID=A0A2P4Q3I1_RHIID|nr:hypothetical protein GLOIN_2v1477862 [Rhizophagus irregularis DAOM 181602=DAOM 197198]POG72207.1 hypothetical protein GLOIN_2v1477862 [Rhizophagus irregularis DAOM 181602=DAOM 197198]|eukprot:XP_025179073.1 hypothetical protein GLOIN_2v1477862 [Rhizophagus irregularis DAOM 181602=DAOM 197198]
MLGELEYQEFLPEDDLLQCEENKKSKNLGGRPKSLVWGTYAKQGAALKKEAKICNISGGGLKRWVNTQWHTMFDCVDSIRRHKEVLEKLQTDYENLLPQAILTILRSQARIFDKEDDLIISKELNLDANAFIKDLDEIIEDSDNIGMEEENIQDIVISENESSIEWDPDTEADKIIDDM